jgi:starch synthase
MSKMNYAIYYVSDGYSTDKKIMGRQSAGKTMMNGVARRWKNDEVHGYGVGRPSGEAMLRQLKRDGFQGTLRWREAPGDKVLESLGAVYFPGPLVKDLAHRRNGRGPTSYSLFGITHTLSSQGAMDQVSELILPPFKPWDALVCTSSAALSVVTRLQDELKAWYAEHLGATRFNPVTLPVIPLGIEAPAFTRTDDQQAAARQAMGLTDNEVVFLFAGRMAFHAKANPAVFYQAIHAAQVRTDKTLVCVEAGVYPTEAAATAFEQARQFLAPGVKFIQVDGQDETAYRQAWKAADVFVSLSDNIQETFGLTPLEAMAAGMPVIVTDWDGYKDTVRDGIDGYRIPVTLPPIGAGLDLGQRHAVGEDNYDYYIGRVSMATAVDLGALTDRLILLSEDENLRRRLGAAGRAKVLEQYDWPIVLGRYVDLVADLNQVRRAVGPPVAEAWPVRPDPFSLFADYPTKTLDNAWRVELRPGALGSIEDYLELGVARYAVTPGVMSRDVILDLLHGAQTEGTVGALLGQRDDGWSERVRALMWLYKLHLINLGT